MLFYRCEGCGNFVTFLGEKTACTPKCCGTAMAELQPNSTGAAPEKHIPVVSCEGSMVTVTVAATEHPMTEEHHIQFIVLETTQGFQKKDLQTENEVSGPMFKIKDDPRVTKVGKFLRKTSIDEFPQFLNVLKGDMSLVGTRPPTEDEFEKYNQYYRRRISMTPGLTGLWQVSGRSSIDDFDDVVRYDLKYIDNWSLGLDIKILIKTIWVVFTGKGSE